MIELFCEHLSVRCIWLYVIMSLTSFRVNPPSIVCLNVKEHLAGSRRHSRSLRDTNEIRTLNLVRKLTLGEMIDFRANLHSIVCLNVKETLARSRRHIWSLSDISEIRTHNHLVHKRTLNHLAKLAKLLCCVLSTYLYGAFDCMLLSSHVRVSEWIYTL